MWPLSSAALPRFSALRHGSMQCPRPAADAAAAGPAGISWRFRYPAHCLAVSSFSLSQPSVYWRHFSVTDGQLSCLCDKCHQATQCHGTRCFSSIKIEGSGMVFERGCLMEPEKIRLHCSTPSSFHYAILCCSQEMCNSNTTARSLMLLLPTGGYHLLCFTSFSLFNIISLRIYCFFISPWRRASSVWGGDFGSVHTRPSGGSGSAVSGISSRMQTVSSRSSTEVAGVWYRTGSHRWSHHLQRGRQHFSGKTKVNSFFFNLKKFWGCSSSLILFQTC